MSTFALWLGITLGAAIGLTGRAVWVRLRDRLPDLSGLRLIPPPREARWRIVAVSTCRVGGRQVIGGYRSRRVAQFIADRLPKRHGVRLEVQPARSARQKEDA